MTARRVRAVFEVSWEVCNKVAGIHAVLRSKVHEAQEEFGDNYFLLGPALHQNPDFEETDESFWRPISKALRIRGLNCRLGHWRIPGRPKVILVDPTDHYDKDQILFRLWEDFGIDSIEGGWDYVEPLLFGTACGEVITAVSQALYGGDAYRVVAHFHDWMAGAGLFYVKKHAPRISTVFTIHGTALGRTMAAHGVDIYGGMDEVSPLEAAKRYGVRSKRSLEHGAATHADRCTAVSEIVADEAEHLTGHRPEAVTPSGISKDSICNLAVDRKPSLDARQAVLEFAERFLGQKFPSEKSHLVMLAGRREFLDRGSGIYFRALAETGRKLKDDQFLITFAIVFADCWEESFNGANPPGRRAGPVPICTHRLHDEHGDPILNGCKAAGLGNQLSDQAKVIFIPIYLHEGDGLLNMSFLDLLKGFDLAVFPAAYEPWGYMPVVTAGHCVPVVIPDHAGFGRWLSEQPEGLNDKGIFVLSMTGREDSSVVTRLSGILSSLVHWDDSMLLEQRAAALTCVEETLWSVFYSKYLDAYAGAIDLLEKQTTSKAKRKPTHTRHLGGAIGSAHVHFHDFNVEAALPEKLRRLRELAYNMWWSWNPEAQNLFEQLDPHLWEELHHNPVRLLSTMSTSRLAELSSKNSYLRLYEDVMGQFDDYVNSENSVLRGIPADTVTRKRPVAYFSTEFGLHESLPIYSGGLGVLAGDHLKSASELNVPLVGMGLFYNQGYFEQEIDASGRQIVKYRNNDCADLPLTRVRGYDNAPMTVSVKLPGRTLYADIWRLDVGRLSVYLLNSNLDINAKSDREITSRLYAGNERTRIKQEILLGVGGGRALQWLGIKPAIYHLNEGHSAFLIFECIRQEMEEHDLNFEEAREVVANRIVFTTHTAVEAGNEKFSEELLKHYFGEYAKQIERPFGDIVELGRIDTEEGRSGFAMTAMAMRNSFVSNAVSELNGRLSRKLWSSLWGGIPRQLVPIESISNGVHIASYIGPEMQSLFDTYFGADWRSGMLLQEDSAGKWNALDSIPDQQLWDTRIEMRQQLIGFVRDHLSERWSNGMGEQDLSRDEIVARLRASSLTIGFARRFAPYKRAHLLFHDLDRLEAILCDHRRPVQVLIAGKAHPDDEIGREILRNIVRITHEQRFAGRVVFLENYDLMTAKKMVQGVDLWLNTPRRPWEASGTSGQKACVNGGINLSVADGWWWEAADGENGWTIGPPPRDVDEDSQCDDDQDAGSLYSLLEDVIVPMYYTRNAKGLPERWLSVMRHSMKTILPKFNSHRMLRDYFREVYLPCAERAAEIYADDCATAKELAAWKRDIASRFSSLKILNITTTGLANENIQVGKRIGITVQIDLGELDPDEVRVELIVGRSDVNRKRLVLDPECIELTSAEESEKNRQDYEGSYVPRDKGHYTYGVRVVPFHEDLGAACKQDLAAWA